MVQDARFGFQAGLIVANDDAFRSGTRATSSKRPGERRCKPLGRRSAAEADAPGGRQS